MVARPFRIMTDEAVESRTSHHNHELNMPVVNGGETPSLCYGCGRKILDRYYLLAVDKQWHAGCLKCADCTTQLDSELTCYAKDGNIYCKEDYYRRFAIKRCARCLHGIAANELVMRARDAVYHLNCFTCASCNSALTTGDQFGMHNDTIYCRNHYELLLRGDYLPGTPILDQGYSPTTPEIPFYNGVGGAQKGRPRKRKSPVLPDTDSCPLGLGLDDPDQLDQYSQGGVPRQKRMRTSFKHHQLRTMKSYFALNHNPDAKDLKQLAQKTGLTKRVLQVWFQNARAKYRRNLLRQEHGGSVQGSGEKAMSETGQSDLSNARSPGGLSDVSSSPSLTDIHSNPLDDEDDDDDDSSSNLSEIFTTSINAMS